MHALGRHILIELNDCNRDILNDMEFLQQTLVHAAKEAGATVLEKSFHHFEPVGVSGVVVLAESHLSIHTWPEYGYAAADIFTCGDSVHPSIAAQVLMTELDSRNSSMMEVRRGLMPAPIPVTA